MPVNESTLAPLVFDQLQQAMAGDPAGFTELYHDYLADAWQALRTLGDAVRQQQAEEVRAKAHHLKGSSMVLGARAVAQCASALEEMGRSADIRTAGAMLDPISVAGSAGRTVNPSGSWSASGKRYGSVVETIS